MPWWPLAKKYPAIADLFINPVFMEPRRNSTYYVVSNWRAFWNYLGDRVSQGYRCEICGRKFRKRGRINRQYNLCETHLRKLTAAQYRAVKRQSLIEVPC
jgi:hypothetical protein